MSVEATRAMSPFIEEKRQELEKRLAELQPMVEEYELIKAALEALTSRRRRG